MTLESMILRACDLQRAAVEKWGETAQSFMTIEEAAEHILVQCRLQRGRVPEVEVPHVVADEAADVIITAIGALMRSGAGLWALESAMMDKLDRLQRRLDGEEGHFGPGQGGREQ